MCNVLRNGLVRAVSETVAGIVSRARRSVIGAGRMMEGLESLEQRTHLSAGAMTLTATSGLTGSGIVELNWTYSASDYKRFEIERKDPGDVNYHAFDPGRINTPMAASGETDVGSLEIGKSYSFRMRAIRKDNSVSDYASASFTPDGITAPTLNTYRATGSDELLVGWAGLTDPDADLVEIEQTSNLTAGNAWEVITPPNIYGPQTWEPNGFFRGTSTDFPSGTVGATAASTSKNAAAFFYGGDSPPVGNYTFRVRYQHDSQRSEWSDPISASTDSVGSGSASFNQDPSGDTLSWTVPSTTADHNFYTVTASRHGDPDAGVAYGDGGGEYDPDEAVSISIADLFSGQLAPGVQYDFAVEMCGVAMSGGVVVDSLTTVANVTGTLSGTASTAVPLMPANLSVGTANPGAIGPVNIVWENTSSDETSFPLDRSTSDTFPSSAATSPFNLGADSPSYTDRIENELLGQTYYYRVKATNSAGSSSYKYAQFVTSEINCITCGGGINAIGGAQGGSASTTPDQGPGGAGVVENTAGSGGKDPSLYELNNSINDITAYYGPGLQTFFHYSSVSGQYVEDFGGTDTLVRTGGQFILSDSSGNRYTFSDSFGDSANGPMSEMTAQLDAAGNQWRVVSRNAAGDPLEMRSTTAAGVDVESWLYVYLSSGENEGKLWTITRRLKDGSSWKTVRTQTYTYYGVGDSGGPMGSVRSVLVTDADGNDVSDDHYRYYTTNGSGGFIGGVKYVFGQASFQRLMADHPTSSFDSLTDAQVAPYADTFYAYNDLNQVATRTIQGEGCSSCSGGQGEYSYSYAMNGNWSQGYTTSTNFWARKTTETQPDGNQNITYYNQDGNVMLSVYRDVTTGAMSGTFHVYDAAGREIMNADVSAVNLPTSLATIEAYNDLLNNVSGNYQYLRDGSGKVTLTDYYGSTTATDTTAGGAAGYVEDVKVRAGETGTAVLVSSQDYILRTDGTITIFPLAHSTQYPNADGTGATTTTYDYDWFTGSLQMQRQTAAREAVSAAQNGSDGAASETIVYNQNGQAIWRKDAKGFITYSAFDAVTGGMIKSIRDVDTSATSTFDVATLPSGWATPTGGGLNLVTSYVVDELGRTTKQTDPNGSVTYTVYKDGLDTSTGFQYEVRTYPGWHYDSSLGKSTTAGPVSVTRDNQPGSYSESLSYVYTPATGVTAPDGTDTISTIQSLSRTHTSDGGQVDERDDYSSLSGVTYSASSFHLGAEGTNYLVTKYGYDHNGNQSKLVSPEGTIHRTEYDGEGRAISTWVGTDDSPTSGWWSTSNLAGTNMAQTSSTIYDNGGAGDGNVTESRTYFGSGSSDYYATNYEYDDRDQLIGMRNPDGTGERYTLDNKGRRTVTDRFANVAVNMDGTLDFGTVVSGVNARLRGMSETSYDNEGRVYETAVYKVDPSTGVIGPKIVQDVWYDLNGQQIKTASSNGLFHKMQYDGASRVIASYASSDASETTSSAYSTAADVANDTIYSTQKTYYVGNLSVITASYQRTAGTSGTSDLTPANSFLQASITWYDAADRPIGIANYGRDTGHVVMSSDGLTAHIDLAMPTALNAATFILNQTIYDDAGRVGVTTDNLNHAIHYTYDLLGRRTEMVENFDDGTADATDKDEDRTTQWIYDPWGRLHILRALNPNGTSVDQQDTEYYYADPTNRSLVSYVAYPDSTNHKGSGSPGVDFDWHTDGEGFIDTVASTADDIDYVWTQYDRLGRKTSTRDQRGVIHTFGYDATTGQPTSDVVTSLGSTSIVDGAIRAIVTGYDDVGRVQTVTSYSNTNLVSTNIANQVAYTYDGWGNVLKSQQASSGAVTSSTPAVQYTFAEGVTSGVAKYVRLSKVTYPDGREVFRLYGAAGGADDLMNLVYEVGGDDSYTNATYDARYDYIGTGTIVRETQSSGHASLDYDYFNDGTLPGLDTFGRVIQQAWFHGGDGDTTFYTYDGNSNRTSAQQYSDFPYYANAAEGEYPKLDDEYTYDGLNRLATFNLSSDSVDASANPVVTPLMSQAWTLDALGNWRDFNEDSNGDGTNDLTQTRTVNAANEIQSISGGGWAGTTYDTAGNMTAMPTPGDETHQEGAVYDAWNRMVSVSQGTTPTTVASYTYDGLGRRITSTESGHTEHDYFNENWQVLETRTDSQTTPTTQNIWSERYIDALVREDRFTTREAGRLDTLFGGDGMVTTDVGVYSTDRSRRMFVQPDGKTVVIGYTTPTGLPSDLAVVRYNVDGSLDAGFGTGGIYKYGTSSINEQGLTGTLMSDGKIVIAGRSGNQILILRLNANGTLDTTFNASGTIPGVESYDLDSNGSTVDVVYDVTSDADGRILIAGAANGTALSGADAFVARFLANGSGIDTTFGSGGERLIDYGGSSGERAYAMTVDSYGRILVTGTAGSALSVARVTASGDLDPNFGSGGKVISTLTGVNTLIGNGIVVDGDGKIDVVGTATNTGTFTHFVSMALLRLTDAGTPDTLFGSGGDVVFDSQYASQSQASAIVLQPDGKILVGGEQDLRSTIWRYNADGSIDLTFGAAGTGVVNTDISDSSGGEMYTSIAYTWDGKIVVAGWAYEDATSGSDDFALARYDADHGLDQTLYYQQDANFNVTSVATPAGAVVERYRYTPYGMPTVLDSVYEESTGQYLSEYGATFGKSGTERSILTGLTELRARTMSASVGSWLQRDPAETIDGANLYQIIRSDPETFVDPDGRQAVPTINPPNGRYEPGSGFIEDSLLVISVLTPAHATGDRGAAEFAVHWSINGPFQNGYIIQHVKFVPSVTDAQGKGVAPHNTAVEYWEAWQVSNSQVFIGTTQDPHHADTFNTVDEDACTKGTVDEVAYVSFIPNYPLKSPPWLNTVSQAGSLPAVTQLAGWSDAFATKHEMKVSWDDTSSPPKKTAIDSYTPH